MKMINNIDTMNLKDLYIDKAWFVTKVQEMTTDILDNNYTIFNNEVVELFRVSSNEVAKWVAEEIWLNYKNWNIGFYQQDDFEDYLHLTIKDNLMGILLKFFVFKGIDFNSIIDMALMNETTTTIHRENEGNYQTTSWDDSGVFNVNLETRDKNIKTFGNRLSAIKGLLNKPIDLSLFNISKVFEKLFVFSFNFY